MEWFRVFKGLRTALPVSAAGSLFGYFQSGSILGPVVAFLLIISIFTFLSITAEFIRSRFFSHLNEGRKQKTGL
jgi:hypothetical protein